MTKQVFAFPQAAIDAANARKAKAQQPSPMKIAANQAISQRDAVNADKPKISPALQEHIARTLKTAQELKPVTAETVVPPGPTVPLATQEVYTPRKDTDTVIADLPSKYVFYPFKELYVGKFKIPHFSKLHEAHVQDNYEYLLEAVSDILGTSEPIHKDLPLAYYLTVPDFYWLLFFIRLNQIKTVLTHNFDCQNPVHLQQVAEGKKPKESLKNSMTVSRSNIHTRVLAAAPDMSQYQFENFTLRPAYMKDVMELNMCPEYATDPEFRYLARIASMISPKDNPDMTLRERIAMIGDLEYEDVARIAEFEKAATSYGADEFTMTTCKECGHQRKSVITLDARSFLPLQ